MGKLRILMGVALAAVVMIVFWNKRTALYEEITFSAQEAKDTPILQPGDCLRQDIPVPSGTMEKISIAFSYQEEIPPETEALVEVFAEGKTVVSQTLSVGACANGSFTDFYIVRRGQTNGKTITVSVSNVTPQGTPQGEFALMASGKEYLFLNGTETCEMNGEKTDVCIFFRAVSVSGYSCYRAATWAFWVLLAGCVAIERLESFRRKGFSYTL